MNIVKLRGRLMTDKCALHKHLSLQLALPSYYGKNLDALHDLLTEISTPTIIAFYNFDKAKEQLGDYADALLEVLSDSKDENKNIELIVYN